MKKFISCFMALAMSAGLLSGMTFSVSAAESESDTDNTMTLSEFMAGEAGDENAEDALGQLYTNFSSGFNEDGSIDDSIYDYDEDQVTDSVSALEDNEYPAAYDLRHVDKDGTNPVTVTYNSETKKNDITGGLSYVTPVKLQNPWGTCWSFGIIAACEASILYEADAGTETADNDKIDLSERHLAWFAKVHLPAEDEEDYGTNYVNNQDGEGTYYIDGTSSSSMEGGFPFYGTSIFAAGEGIVTEEFAPYIGAAKMVMCRRKSTADTHVYTEKYIYYDSVADWEAETDEGIKENYFLFCYSSKDDWTLDESLRFYQSLALEESSILPSAKATVNKKTGVSTLNEDGINAIKEELTQGRAVNICYLADNSDPNADVTLNTSRYINSNYAHYCWDTTAYNHSVCIVGWDDDYDASNFGQEHPVKYDSSHRAIFKLKNSDQQLNYTEDGKKLYYVDEQGTTHEYETWSDEIETVREEDGSASVPSGNGAWIVKNSWGASTNDFPNYNTWGADGSGYFYLSYYDTSIAFIETFDFAVTEEEQEEYSEYGIVDQYDYMIARSSNQSVVYDVPTMMANVYTAQEDMQIEAVSCETTTPGTTVSYGICLLDDDEDYPTDDDKIIVNEESVTYTYGGYHRQKLDNPITVKKGQKYAVMVAETSVKKDSAGKERNCYYICSNSSYSKTVADEYNWNYYTVGVVNPGESFILSYGYNSDKLTCTDYYNYLSVVRNTDEEGKYYVYDNFSIKAYASPVTAMYRLYNPNSGEHLYTSSEDEVSNLTELGWTDEGTAWYAPQKSDTPVYRLYNPNNGDHHYTTSADEIDMLTALGWQDEGIAWYSGGDAAISRLFNPNEETATHHYTGFDDEVEMLTALGWVEEGIAWNAVSIADVSD